MSSFAIKLIAAVCMLIDHTGLILFPQYKILRVIGRIAFPLYAYCIAEGFRYTRSRTKYFLRIFLLGSACQAVYTVVSGDLYIGILLVFSMSIILMELADCVKKALREEGSAISKVIFGGRLNKEQDKTVTVAALCAGVILVFVLCLYVEVDYGFFGVMLPVFTSLFTDRKQKMVMFSACLIALCIDMTDSFMIQYWSLLTIPLLALYNGKKGKYSMKYFFYIFYPLHLAVLYGISYLI